MTIHIDQMPDDVKLKADGVSVPETAEGGVENPEESQDHAAVVVQNGVVLAVLADGVSKALCGGGAAKHAVDTAVDAFRSGTEEAVALMNAVVTKLWEFNKSESDSKSSDIPPWQCTCVLCVITSSGDFQWGAVGDCVIEVGNDEESDVLTTRAAASAKKYMHRVGLPPERLSIFSGEDSITEEQRIRLYSDGFEEWMEDCIGLTFPKIKRFLKKQPLADDTTIIQIAKA